jgi:hypothetical protein
VAALLRDEPGRPLADLARELAATRTRLERLRYDADDELAINAAFDLSYEHLSSAQQHAFRMLTAIPGTDASTPAAAAVFGLPEADSRRLIAGDRPDQLLRGRLRALGVVTGDVGLLTVALRAAVSTLDPTRHQVIYIANPAFGTRGLYVTIVRALGAQPRYLKAELMAQASDLLAAETAERHRRVVLICDWTNPISCSRTSWRSCGS